MGDDHIPGGARGDAQECVHLAARQPNTLLPLGSLPHLGIRPQRQRRSVRAASGGTPQSPWESASGTAASVGT